MNSDHQLDQLNDQNDVLEVDFQLNDQGAIRNAIEQIGRDNPENGTVEQTFKLLQQHGVENLLNQPALDISSIYNFASNLTNNPMFKVALNGIMSNDKNVVNQPPDYNDEV